MQTWVYMPKVKNIPKFLYFFIYHKSKDFQNMNFSHQKFEDKNFPNKADRNNSFTKTYLGEFLRFEAVDNDIFSLKQEFFLFRLEKCFVSN